MTKATPEMTIDELERALGTRQRSLDTLLRKRAKLVKDLETTDAAIKEIGGAASHNFSPRPRNAKSLGVVVTELLSMSPGTSKPTTCGHFKTDSHVNVQCSVTFSLRGGKLFRDAAA